jgi:hypothetical protein
LTGEAAQTLSAALPTAEQLLPGVEWKALPHIARMLSYDEG